MVLVSYSHRILVDDSFIEWISKSQNKSKIIKMLLRININSKEHPKENVVILEEDFNKLCSNNVIKDKDIIKGCISPYNLKEKLDPLASSDDAMNKIPLELKRLLAGVFLTNDSPFRTILITTNGFKQKYNQDYSNFLAKLKNFDVKDENEGLIILEDLFKKYCSEHEK